MYAKSMAMPRLRGCLPDARSRILAPGLCTPRQGHGHDNQIRYLSSHSGTATVALLFLRLRSRSSLFGYSDRFSSSPATAVNPQHWG